MATSIPLPLLYNYRKITVVAILLVSLVGGCGFADGYPERNIYGKVVNNAPDDLPGDIYSFQVVNEFPHDPAAFTEGLLYTGNDTLFESTGLFGKSSVREIALATGKVQEIHKLDRSYFGEGLTLLGERFFQLTYLDKTGFIYDRNNFSKFETFTNKMEDGWGLTTDGKILFGSDGTSKLYHIDPNSLEVTQKYTVKYKNHEVHNINELEYINGEIWANVLPTDCIAIISQQTGTVRGWILLQSLRNGLVAAGSKNIDVLNGIAWDQERNRTFVTGKFWPKLFEIKPEPDVEKLDTIVKLCIPRPHPFVK